jgi:hypothetical protein
MLLLTTLIFGPWTKFISSNMDPGAECGCHLSVKILLCCIIQREKVLATLVPCGYTMESCYIKEKPIRLMLKRIGVS